MTRNRSIDVLKIVMAVFVVGVHVNPLESLGHTGELLFGNGLFRLAVPVFFLINGYYFEDTAAKGGTARYVGRALTLYAIWSLVYLPAWALPLDRLSAGAISRNLIIGYWHLWYLPGLALAAALGAATRRWPPGWTLLAMALAWLTATGIVYGIATDTLAVRDTTYVYRNGLLMGFPFLTAGMLIRRYQLEERITLGLLVPLTLGAVALVLLESVLLSTYGARFVNHDCLFSLALACPLLLLVALKLRWPGSGKALATYANGLYFLHVAFCVIGFRFTALPHAAIWIMAVAGGLAGTWVLIRTGLARRVL